MAVQKPGAISWLVGVWAAFGLAACIDYEHRATLEAAVRDQVTDQQLPSRIPLHFEVHQRGTQSWQDLQLFLDREPPDQYRKLRDAVKKYPRILYHTTEWQMTWVFIDEKGVIRDFYLTSQ